MDDRGTGVCICLHAVNACEHMGQSLEKVGGEERACTRGGWKTEVGALNAICLGVPHLALTLKYISTRHPVSQTWRAVVKVDDVELITQDLAEYGLE